MFVRDEPRRTDHYAFMVLQHGQPMCEAEKPGEHWALYFAGRSSGPTLWRASKGARNAIRRQKAREKKHGRSLGYLSVMRVLLP